MRIDRAVKLAGNYNRINELVVGNVGISAITGLFNDEVFLKEKATAEEMQAIIKFAEPMKNNTLTKKKVKVVIKISKEMQADRLASEAEEV